MAAVSETLTGTQDSSSFTPTEQTSEVSIGNYTSGSLLFQMSTDGGTVWRTVTTRRGFFVFMTPDPNIIYRFKAQSVSPSVDVYVGP